MRKIFILFIPVIFVACQKNSDLSDAYGNFEAVTVSVSSETGGKLISLNVTEGQEISAGMVIGIVDTTDHYLKILQLQAQKNAIAARLTGVQGQIEVQRQQKKNLMVEKERVEKLLAGNAATQKQMDDVNGSLDLIHRQVSSIETQKAGILEEQVVIDRQIDQVRETIRKCYIRNPLSGNVLVKYAEAGDITAPGKTLYKIANLSELELKVYVSGDMLPQVKIGQEVEVLIDKDKKSNQALKGTVSWVSQKAEFTPKIIQTKEERVDLVYAVKVRVPNDGSLKIAMPGEVNFK